MATAQRRLEDLVSVGPAIVRDFELLGIQSVAQLARRNPEKLYEQLCIKTGTSAGHLLPGCLSGGGGAGEESEASHGRAPVVVLEPADGKRAMPGARKRELTTPDLVLLSLLAERPMHGYQANLELERRQVRDWAGISRPQVYYSLEKLQAQGLIRAAENADPAAGPERSVFTPTAKGRAALAAALEREEWATQRERPPFLTWIALSWQARPGSLRTAIAAAAEIPGERNGARRRDAARDPGGSWPPVS